MSQVTLGEIIKSGLLETCSVIAGHHGLSRPVMGSLRVRDPFSRDKLPAHMLIGIDERLFSGDQDALTSFLRYCARSHASGVAIMVSVHDSILLRDLTASSYRLDLPVVRVNSGYDLSDWLLLAGNETMAAASRKIGEHRRHEYRIRNLALDGSGLDAIADYVSRQVGNPVLITASDRRLIAAGWPNQSAGYDTNSWLKKSARRMLPVDGVERELSSLLKSDALPVFHKMVVAGGRSVG